MSNFGDHPTGFFGDSSFYNDVATTSLRLAGATTLTNTYGTPTSRKKMSFDEKDQKQIFTFSKKQWLCWQSKITLYINLMFCTFS